MAYGSSSPAFATWKELDCDGPAALPRLYAGDPYPAFKELRATAPVCWNEDTAFWALLKYEDMRFVSANPMMFSSAKGITIPDPALPNPVQEGNLIFTDHHATGSCAS
jgi:cytochrome P450